MKKAKAVALRQLNLPGKVTGVGLVLPPSLSHDDWIGIGQQLRQMESGVMWWLGDWLAFGEKRKWGEQYEEAEKIGFEYGTAANCVYVSKAFAQFSRRREKLGWAHHQEVAGLEPRKADQMLAKAERTKWSVADLRRAVSDLNRGVKRKQQQFEAEELSLANVLYADPPWQYSNSGFLGAAEDHYPTMPTDDICAMGVDETVANDAALFLWVTNPLLFPDGQRVVEAWGFEYKTNFVWIKDQQLYGKLGFYNYSRHELLLLGIRGSFLPEINDLPDSVITAKAAEHSRKPDQAYDLIETMYPSSIKTSRELFCRGEGRRGWMPPFGNEATANAGPA